MRSIVKLLVFAGLVYFGWHMYQQTVATQAAAAAQATAAGIGETGFVQTGDVDESERDVVLILRPADCPSEQAQRAEALARELTRRRIPHKLGDSMSIHDDSPTQESVDDHNRAMDVFNQGAPAVYINGRGKSNPTADEVEVEYKRTRGAS
jgi:hypothetical protein